MGRMNVESWHVIAFGSALIDEVRGIAKFVHNTSFSTVPDCGVLRCCLLEPYAFAIVCDTGQVAFLCREESPVWTQAMNVAMRADGEGCFHLIVDFEEDDEFLLHVVAGYARCRQGVGWNRITVMLGSLNESYAMLAAAAVALAALRMLTARDAENLATEALSWELSERELSDARNRAGRLRRMYLLLSDTCPLTARAYDLQKDGLDDRRLHRLGEAVRVSDEVAERRRNRSTSYLTVLAALISVSTLLPAVWDGMDRFWEPDLCYYLVATFVVLVAVIGFTIHHHRRGGRL